MDQRGISEADLRKAIQDGGALSRVLVVEYPHNGDLVLCLRIAGRAGWSYVSLRRSQVPKTWSDYRVLRRLVAELGHEDVFCVAPAGHPRLAKLGIRNL